MARRRVRGDFPHIPRRRRIDGCAVILLPFPVGDGGKASGDRRETAPFPATPSALLRRGAVNQAARCLVPAGRILLPLPIMVAFDLILGISTGKVLANKK